MERTTNLDLPLGTLGDVEFKQSFAEAMEAIDAAVGAVLTGSKTYDPPSMTTGTIGATTTVTVTGAALGDFVVATSFSLDAAGVEFIGYVSAPDTVTVTPRNPTAGTVNLAEGTLRVLVRKA